MAVITGNCAYCKVEFLPTDTVVETILSNTPTSLTVANYHNKCWWQAMYDLEARDLAAKQLEINHHGTTPKLPPKV